jgi:hypothetical protein
MPGRDLKRARHLLRRHRFREVIRLLEPQVFGYRQSPLYYKTLGLACLYGGDWGGAGSYLERARTLSPEDGSVLVGLAAVAIRQRRTDAALRLLLEALEQNPRDRRAKRGLELVRRTGPDVEVWERRGFRRMLPALPRRVARWFVVAAVSACLVAGGFGVYEYLRNMRPARVEGLDLPQMPLSVVAGDALFQLSESEVRRTFEKARRLFDSYRDNLACVEVNRLLLSNADQAVKERVLVIKEHLEEPDLSSFQDNFSYGAVSAVPGLYDGCFVRWTGRAAGVRVGAQWIEFEFLVGYEKGQELEGVVVARVPFATDIRSGNNVEVLARVVSTSGSDFLLEVTSLRRIVVPR